MRKMCPVCGRRYQGSLADHLDRKLKESGGITRCEWNLNEARITYAAEQMMAAGWVRAGTAAAPTARLLRTSGIARMAASGDYSTEVHARYLDPLQDVRCWWLRSWAYPMARVLSWPIAYRVQIIKEVCDNAAAHALIDAAYRVGGPEALVGLIGHVFPFRCGQLFSYPQEIKPVAPPRGGLRGADQCVLAEGHGPLHQGRRGLTWWRGGYASSWVPLDID